MAPDLPGTGDVRVVFMGTPEFSVPTLKWLLTSPMVGNHRLRLQAVYSQPDRPAGRGNRMHASAVKEAAQSAGVTVFQPERIRSPDALETLDALQPDLVVVAAYSQILPRRLLELPAFGCLNVHASLLPAYRGAAPIHAAILHGDIVTGVTIMHMDVGLDTGGIISQSPERIMADDTTATLSGRLSVAGARLLATTLRSWLDGSIGERAQDSSMATVARPLRKEEGLIDWACPVEHVERLVRAMNPWPIAHTTAGTVPLRVLASHALPETEPFAVPGTLAVRGGAPVVATGDGQLVLDIVQPAGKRAMCGRDWLRGAGWAVGGVLGAGERDTISRTGGTERDELRPAGEQS